MKQESIGSAPNFQPRQIVCLEHEATCLYAEVIEVIASRQVCWVRPLLLAVPAATDTNDLLPRETLWDLRLGADLVWPISLFRPALDTEVIPLLVQLDDSGTPCESNPEAHRQLSCFVHQVWQAYQSAFQAS